tara:strand:- start:527 stop:1573 length:1047 start_codon:yes stop_codon:yes gene_type:complete
MFSILRPLIFNLEPEIAHDLAIQSLKTNLIPKGFFKVEGEEMLETDLFKKKIKNPIGLAAGFDKSAEVYNPLFKLGFGFVEIGTVTPRRQLGNPKPRIFRLEKDKAMINRLGFNNHGADVIASRIEKIKPDGILGVNIGPNKDSLNKLEDYLTALTSLHHISDYITINISSPNTEGLRDFHNKDLMQNLFNQLNKLKSSKKIKKPLVIKISPDIDDKNISEIIELILKFKIDGVIISNSSDGNRQNLSDKNKIESGGLSGEPIRDISTKLIKKFYKEIKNKIYIIGVGGVDSGDNAFDKFTAGANAVQLYTGMIYKGPGIVKEIKKDLISILKKNGLKNIAESVGINA